MDAAAFPEFFALLNGGHAPFAWQTRLLDYVLDHGRWPAQVVAPTGAGKSSVVEVHVFANALAAQLGLPKLPRRLCVVVNRRALVDHHLDKAERIAEALRHPEHPLLHEVAEALRARSGTDEPLSCVNMRGGITTSRVWLDDPRQVTVIAATPDMWGSRLLFRGYGSSRGARPREAGILAFDSVMVLDEAHLNRQLLRTARRVSELVELDAVALGVRGLQVCATTATPSEGFPAEVTVGVREADLEQETVLAKRLTRPKRLRYVETPRAAWQGRSAPQAYIDLLATTAVEMRQSVPDGPPRTVGVVVNTVEAALRVAVALRRSTGQPDSVVCWVGRMRPADLEERKARNPGLFEVTGDHSVAYLVATQTVEVGVDLDLAAMVSELAPASSLAQRAGRVNRLGLREESAVTVIGPPAGSITDRPPYSRADLDASVAWLRALEASGRDLSPWALAQAQHAAPVAELPRWILSTLQRYDVELLAETCEPLFAEPDLTFFLRDSLESDPAQVGFVVRRPLPEDAADALGVLRATPPGDREMYPTSLGLATELVQHILANRGRVFLVREGETEMMTEGSLQPGDVLVTDFTPISLDGVTVPPSLASEKTPRTFWGDDDSIEVMFAGGPSELGEFARLSHEEATALAAERWPGGELTLPPEEACEDGRLDWAVVAPKAALADDEEERQDWSPSGTPVTLDIHSEAVGARAAAHASGVGLPDDLVAALGAAGLLHDAGKLDERFQEGPLKRPPGAPPLAKSGLHNAAVRKNRRTSALPRGWRHEQMSAVHAVVATRDQPHHDLVTRLVGTSHGWGRSLFPHTMSGLIDKARVGEELLAAARALFETGAGWSDIVRRTHQIYGVWGCAYLEAILRSADCMVSKEGS